MDHSPYDNEGFEALDIPTTAALQYVRRTAEAAARRAAANHANAVSPDAAHTLLVVDAGCDMPSAWLARNNVAVVPIQIEIGAERLVDQGEEPGRLNFASRLSALEAKRRPPLAISPTRPVELRDYLQTWMTPGIDNVLQLSFAATRSSVYLSALAASQSLMLIHNKVRRSLGASGPLKAWVIDSFTGLAGFGVLVAHAVRLRDSGVPAADIATAMEDFRRHVRTLLVADDLGFLYRTLQTQGASGERLPRWKIWLAELFNWRPILLTERGSGGMLERVKGFSAACDRAFAITSHHVSLGLSTPTVCVSVAGSMDSLRALPAFVVLAAECRRSHIELIVTPMSMTGCVKLGPGAISVAFASERFHR